MTTTEPADPASGEPFLDELARAWADRDREHKRAEGWADQYNRVARQIADVRDERDTALEQAKQAHKEAAADRMEWARLTVERNEARTELARVTRLLADAHAEIDRVSGKHPNATGRYHLTDKAHAVLNPNGAHQ